MKNFFKVGSALFTLAMLIAMTAVACGHEGVQNSQTNNPNMHVTLLFEHDGCKVYRFTDDAEYIYYADCRGSSSTAWQEPHGKVTIPKQVVTTEGK